MIANPLAPVPDAERVRNHHRGVALLRERGYAEEANLSPGSDHLNRLVDVAVIGRPGDPASLAIYGPARLSVDDGDVAIHYSHVPGRHVPVPSHASLLVRPVSPRK